jgi:hypothetical protein
VTVGKHVPTDASERQEDRLPEALPDSRRTGLPLEGSMGMTPVTTVAARLRSPAAGARAATAAVTGAHRRALLGREHLGHGRRRLDVQIGQLLLQRRDLRGQLADLSRIACLGEQLFVQGALRRSQLVLYWLHPLAFGTMDFADLRALLLRQLELREFTSEARAESARPHAGATPDRASAAARLGTHPLVASSSAGGLLRGHHDCRERDRGGRRSDAYERLAHVHHL